MTGIEKMVVVRIQGHVQGVGFRAFVQREAERLGVRGWVRNRRNGDVEAFFAGRIQAVDTLIAESRRGPDSAHVTNFVAHEPTPDQSADLPSAGFRLLPTI